MIYAEAVCIHFKNKILKTEKYALKHKRHLNINKIRVQCVCIKCTCNRLVKLVKHEKTSDTCANEQKVFILNDHKLFLLRWYANKVSRYVIGKRHCICLTPKQVHVMMENIILNRTCQFFVPRIIEKIRGV